MIVTWPKSDGGEKEKKENSDDGGMKMLGKEKKESEEKENQVWTFLECEIKLDCMEKRQTR